mgnify:CR=1 FL=1|jgi:acyl carrier protein
MNVTQTVLDYFVEKGNFSEQTDEDILALRYLDQGTIDSMGIIDMVIALEQGFDVQLSAEDMQSKEFQTVGGVISIIERLVMERRHAA